MKNKFLTLCMMSIFATGSFAQNTDIEEIITTATKTEKTLQEVPVAVSVISADEIDKANIVDAFDLMQVVPSLDTRQSADKIQAESTAFHPHPQFPTPKPHQT